MKTNLSLLTALVIMTGATYAQAQVPLVFGNTYVSGGDSAEFGGDIVANTYLVVGAGAIVTGNIQTGTAVTIGAGGAVRSDYDDGISDIDAGTAATMGASAEVDGNVNYGTALTLGAGAHIGSDTNYAAQPMAYTSGQVNNAQNYYNGLTAEEKQYRNLLESTIPQDLTLDPSDGNTYFNDTDYNTIVYNAASLTTTAGITITLKGNHNWVFNITDMLSLGAGTKIAVPDGGSVTWNAGGYASVGSDADVIGSIFAGGYVSTGMGSNVTGANAPSVTKNSAGYIVESYCGGIFSATSYVTIGASGTVSSCEQSVIEPM
jgi:hypothetical protein